jgi:hypothetical protein
LLQALKETAHRRRISLKRLIDELLRLGLTSSAERRGRKRYRCPTFAMGSPVAGTFDKALGLATALEDEEVARKLEQRR